MRRFFSLAIVSALAFGIETPTPLGTFNSDYEGVYDVRVSCREQVTTPDCEQLNREAKLVILNLKGQISVALGFPEQNLPRYAFLTTELRDGGRLLTGSTDNPLSAVASGASEFQAEIASESWGTNLAGWIRDPRFLNDLRVEGRLALSPSTYYHDPTDFPVTPAQKAFLGRYLVTGADRIWVLTIRNRLTTADTSELTAEISDFGGTDGSPGSGVRVRFQSVDLSLENGFLSLASPLSLPHAYLKWTLSLDKGDAEGINLRGMMMSSTGQTSKLFIQRIL